jgi:predicted lipoprotein
MMNAAAIGRPAIFLGASLLLLNNAASGADWAERLHLEWSAPRAVEFARVAGQLTPAIQIYCDAPAERSESALQQARLSWRGTLIAWERLSGVAFGPVLERRAQRQIDFTPTRPRMIEKAVHAAPADAAAMELIGTPAKGLPALEWLLWVQPIQPASAECRYAEQVAAEIQREATALSIAPPPAADPATTLSELVNQWVGGLDRLRWNNMEMPAHISLHGGGKQAPNFPRRASGADAAGWAAQWQALRVLASGPVSLQTALREHGRNDIADALTQAVNQADVGMQDLNDADLSRVIAAAQRLAALKRVVVDKVAPALGVNIGFSDADGD